jgi:Cu/Ag efflux protein CusF
MRVWKVVLLVDLALALGVGGGYLWWAREVRALRQELATARQAAEARQSTDRSWTVRGIVRVALPSQQALFITHETIPELMPGMTMGFEVADPKLLDGLAPGDPIRFTLRREGERLRVVAIERQRG